MRHGRRWYRWAATSGLFYALWEFAAWLTRTDFHHWVKERERVSPAWIVPSVWYPSVTLPDYKVTVTPPNSTGDVPYYMTHPSTWSGGGCDL